MDLISELKLLTFTAWSSQQFGQECEVAACQSRGPDALDWAQSSVHAPVLRHIPDTKQRGIILRISRG